MLDFYINRLLYHHQCVIVPDFGAFVTNSKSASFISEEILSPPMKEISFNASLTTNDGLLAKSISHDKGIDYQDANKLLTTWVNLWREKLCTEKILIIEKIGKITETQENLWVFEPFSTENYLMESFGFQSVVVKKIPVAKQKKLPQNTDSLGWVRYAAVFIIVFSAMSWGWYSLNSDWNFLFHRKIEKVQVAENQSQIKINQASFFSDISLELPQFFSEIKNDLSEKKQSEAVSVKTENNANQFIENQQENTEKENFQKKYFWISGAFSTEKNAQNRVKQLHKKGFKNASIIGKNARGLFLVAFDGFVTEQEAQTYRKELKIRKIDTWLYQSK